MPAQLPEKIRSPLAIEGSRLALDELGGVNRQFRISMKITAVFLLFVAFQCCFGVNDTNVIAAGDWSEPVSCQGEGLENCGTLRGRLLLCDSPKDGSAAVYLELQELAETWGGTIEVYCNMEPTVAIAGGPDAQGHERIRKAAAQWELGDGSGRPIPEAGGGFGGGAPGVDWVTMPTDSTVRLRASVFGGGRLKNGSLHIFFLAKSWVIPPRSTNDYYLSCTFTVEPPTNHVALPEHRVWHGTLKLPSMKIPVQKP